ncbi:hypothetical protein F5I97DRAFT_204059 [Phlebopus sp. FC_14]|nr:hypothetical protein F5I97DRAFT_204059 [Phlebopus sp. FC_14]
MTFGLIIGTERAISLQNAIQDELTKRGFSPDADPVMAEYITIMIINNKTAAQITSELEDLIGSDFDPSFTDWLFLEAAKRAPDSDVPTSTATPSTGPVSEDKANDAAPHATPDTSRKPPNAPRSAAPLYQQAISSALPTSSHSGQKRTASARSPSPTGHGPPKSRRTDLPTGPRAMQNSGSGGPRSLLDRVGGRNGNPNFTRGDEIQARIDAVTNNSAPDPSMMMAFQNGGMNGMDMGMAPNPMMLQEMMMNQMALMAQMASSMGMLNPATGQMMGVNGGFPMQQGDVGLYSGGGMNGNGFVPGGGNAARGRGGATRGGRGRGGGRGGHFGSSPAPPAAETQATAEPATPSTAETSQLVPIAAPVPTPASSTQPVPVAAAAPAPQLQPQRIPYALPERPQSPTLCKFGTKCTNSQCRYSHPSPVATAESGVVLSTEACEKGKDCKDKDCIKAHVSPAVNISGAEQQKPTFTPGPPTHTTAPHSHSTTIPCRFGAACTRPGCTYSHPPRPSTNHFAQQCRFGASCTRATCPFQHPEGRVLPTTFHRGLATDAPMVNVRNPETGTMGAPSPHRSVTFNKGTDSVKEKLQKQIRELEAQKKAVSEAEAAASKKDESSKSVPIAV